MLVQTHAWTTPTGEEVVSFTAEQHPELLAAEQRLDISLSTRIVVLVSNASPVRVCQLTPTPFRLLLLLLLGKGAVVSYARLLAGLDSSEAQVQALLEARCPRGEGTSQLTLSDAQATKTAWDSEPIAQRFLLVALQ